MVQTAPQGGVVNYQKSDVEAAQSLLTAKHLPPQLMIDCSHGNSNKQPERQPEVLDAIISQVEQGNEAIIGTMIESNLEAGNQKFPAPLETLKRGVSITDGCIDWDTTEASILNAYDRLASRFTSA